MMEGMCDQARRPGVGVGSMQSCPSHDSCFHTRSWRKGPVPMGHSDHIHPPTASPPTHPPTVPPVPRIHPPTLPPSSRPTYPSTHPPYHFHTDRTNQQTTLRSNRPTYPPTTHQPTPCRSTQPTDSSPPPQYLSRLSGRALVSSGTRNLSEEDGPSAPAGAAGPGRGRFGSSAPAGASGP